MCLLPVNSDVHSYNTRNCGDLTIPRTRLQKTSKSFPVSGLSFFNMLPPIIRELEAKKFEKTVRTWLSLNPFYSLTEFLDSMFEGIIDYL